MQNISCIGKPHVMGGGGGGPQSLHLLPRSAPAFNVFSGYFYVSLNLVEGLIV